MKQRSVELIVGLFILVGFFAFGYLALRLGEVSFLSSASTYTVQAEFDNVSGVKVGANVQIAGVSVGTVEKVQLSKDHVAVLDLRVQKNLQIPSDSIASVKSQGLIGDKFIQISLGGAGEMLKPGAKITETESSVDVESLISKFAFGSAKKGE